MIDFTFDEELHRYSVAGRDVPACTRVLSSGGLVDFSFVGQDILERKSELGREAHKACHLWIQGKAFTCDDAVRGYLNSCIETCHRLNFKPRLSEHQQIASVHGMEFGMQIDAEGLIQNEETIVEWKIGEVLPHHDIQLAGYACGLYHARLETPLGRFRSRKRIVVKLQEDGSLGKIHRCEDKSDFDTFTSALYVTHWKKRHGNQYREITP